MELRTREGLLKAIEECRFQLSVIEAAVKAEKVEPQHVPTSRCNICDEMLDDDPVVQASWVMAGGQGHIKPLVHKCCDVKERVLLAQGIITPLDIWRPRRL